MVHGLCIYVPTNCLRSAVYMSTVTYIRRDELFRLYVLDKFNSQRRHVNNKFFKEIH